LLILSVVIGAATTAQGSDDINAVVTEAFASFPRLTSSDLLQSEDLRDFFDHLRTQQTAFMNFPQHAQDYHVNQLLHAVRSVDSVDLEGDIALADLSKACQSVPDQFNEHAMPEWSKEGSACDGLPQHILNRPGSCELKRIRYKLEQNRDSAPLFDTKRWVTHFERGLKMMWEVHESGQPPMHVVVNPVSQS